MRKIALLAAVLAVLAFANVASAQQGDAAIGFGTLVSSASCDPVTLNCAEKGGLYTTIGGDVIFHKRIGFGFDANWKTSQGQRYLRTALPPDPFRLQWRIPAALGQEGRCRSPRRRRLADHSLLPSLLHQRLHL